ncbi:hypothetical protein K4K57_003514 [Colletotrichum sp. SAR 10_99]|nr:hypothetical protein K4K57_003514 [Colletotrichum sp. SAR 10_99]
MLRRLDADRRATLAARYGPGQQALSQSSAQNAAAAVYFDANDFSDDDDLSFQLASPPQRKKQTSTPKTTRAPRPKGPKGNARVCFRHEKQWQEERDEWLGHATREISFWDILTPAHIDTLLSFTKTCERLTKFSFTLHDVDSGATNSAEELTDDDIVKIAQACPKLKTFDLPGASGLTEKSFLALCEHCPDLTHLHISKATRCEGNTGHDKVFEALTERPELAPKLKELRIADSNFTKKVLRVFSKARPKVHIILMSAIALADQTLKLSSVWSLCPATKEKANDLKESAHEGLFPDSRTNERYTTDDYRCDVRDHTKDLRGYFKDEAKYHDLIVELCQIFRDHYVLKYMDCHVDDLPVALHKLCGVRSDSHCADYIRTRTIPTWDELLRGMQEEALLMSNYESALREYEREHTIKRIARLFCEDGWTYREYGQERADFLQILKENTPSGRRQRDFNRYMDKLLRGEYNAMAGHLRRDRNLLTTRLHRAEDASLRSILSDAINKKEKSLFLVNKYIFNGYDDPFWRVYPTKEAVEMSVFQDYWEQRPRRRTDGEDDLFGIPDMGLGPFSW